MTQSTHGGARPATRPDDKRLSYQPPRSPGRQPSSYTLRVGDTLYLARQDAEGNGIGPAELWTVSEIARTHIKFASDNGDTVRIVR